MGILCMNHVAHWTEQPGDDPLGCGQWCWTQLQGPEGFFLWIVTMYWPCFSMGPQTTYQQQVQRLTKLQCYENPWDAVLIDIAKEIQTWQEFGNHIILLTDFNNDVESLAVQQWAAALSLVEAIMCLHPARAPPTFQWGSWPINEIFAAPQLLKMAAGEYLSFGDAIPSNHWAIWLDLHLPELCPQHQETHTKPWTWCLQCKDPWVVTRYNLVLVEILTKQNIPLWLQQLNDTLQGLADLCQWHCKE